MPINRAWRSCLYLTLMPVIESQLCTNYFIDSTVTHSNNYNRLDTKAAPDG